MTGWMEDNEVNMIDNIDCKYKEMKLILKLALNDENDRQAALKVDTLG